MEQEQHPTPGDNENKSIDSESDGNPNYDSEMVVESEFSNSESTIPKTEDIDSSEDTVDLIMLKIRWTWSS